MNFKKVFLRNFKNYDKETLDLESSSFWIFRGKNSSGKSTLACDTLTYALFGKIKAMDDPQDTKVSVDDIVKRGKTKATVRIEFTNKTDEYVIERIREIKKSSSKEYVSIKKNGKIIHPKDAPKTKADQWIRNNLWSYKDFTNTTLIMQDEMTKALNLRTGERKDYLERLFGIKDFQEMGVISREKAKEILGNLASEDAIINEKRSRLLDNTDLQTVKLELDNIYLQSEQNEVDCKLKRNNKNEELLTLRSTEDELNKIKNDIVEDQRKLNEIEDLIEQKETQLNEFNKAIENKESSTDDLNKIQKIEKKIEDLEVVKGQISKLERLKSSLSQQIKDHEKSMKKEIIVKSSEIEKTEIKLREYKEELTALRALESEKPDIENALKNEKKILKELKDLNNEKMTKLDLQSKLEKNLNEKEIKIQTFQDQLLLKQAETKKLEEYQLDYDNRVRAKKDLSSQEMEMQSISSDIKSVKDEVVSKNTTLQVLKNSMLTRNKTLDDLETEISEISSIHDHATCSTCKQSISSQHIEEIISDLELRKKSIKKENQNTLNTTQQLEIEINQEKGKLNSYLEKENNIKENIKASRKASDGIDASLNQLNKILLFQKELEQFETDGGLEALYPELTAKIKSLEDQISNIIVDESKLAKLDAERDELITKREMLKNLNQQITKIDSIEAKITELADLNFKNTEIIENIEIELREEKYSEQQRIEILDTEKELNQLNSELVGEHDLMSSLIALDPETVRKNIADILATEKSKDGLLGELKGIKSHYTNLKGEINLNLKTAEDDKYSKIDERVVQSQNALASHEESYVKSIEAKQEAESNLNQHLQIINSQEALEKEIENFELKIKDKREDQDTFKHLEKIFQQIGGRILSRLRYQINVATIDILSLLGNPQLEGITLNEDFSITIQTPNGDERPSFFSGGQKVRIGFAFRLALSKVLAEFRGNEMDTLIIDEGGFGALDEDGQEGVIDVFKSLQDRFERVLIISHIPKITDNLPGAQLQIKEGKIMDRVN